MTQPGIKQVILILPELDMGGEIHEIMQDVQRYGFGLVELLSEAVRVSYILSTRLRQDDDFETFLADLTDWAYTDANDLLMSMKRDEGPAYLKAVSDDEYEKIVHNVSMAVSIVIREFGHRLMGDIIMTLKDSRVGNLEQRSQIVETDVQVIDQYKRRHYRLTMTFME